MRRRLYSHKSDINKKSNNTALACHAEEMAYEIDFDGISNLADKNYEMKQKIREVLSRNYQW